MPVSDGYKAIGPAWASASTADRTDPDDAGLTPPIDIEEGYPDSFSASGGDTPRRPVVNELLHRYDSAALDVRNFGILPWDADVDTVAGGVKQVTGTLYRALVDNGPTYMNAISPTAVGQTVWTRVTGTINLPDAPDMPTATTPRSGELDWMWNCPLDGGRAVTSFNFEWRTSGQTIWTPVSVPTPFYLLTGLPNGMAIEAQVRAITSFGTGPYSQIGSATPQGTIPGGGNTLALRATEGDQQITLNWLEPDDGGLAIQHYTYQWRTSTQTFGITRQGMSTSLTAIVTGLTNGTAYFFRIQAENSAGVGPWSNEATATPVAPTPPPPADTAPSAPTALTGTPRRPLIVDWTWELPNSNGGQRIESYGFQWRYQGDSWGTTNLTTGLERASMRITVADTSRAVQARVRAINNVGTSVWITPTVTVAASSLLGVPTQRHRFTSSQTFTWPYPDLERAVIVLVEGAG